ncbi:hypothetical protein BJP36_39280 [Moorena producens JHB]|uniref:Uncharacterized protein n=1 Tax=Moorena producens (strain JHB) TaxID=1454205 RepID=A0A9Q9UWP3_MOOP1|nr:MULTISPECIES: hypothetical protein [Moorena]NEQ06648.1 hypothetical protein [Moorena sp. SIO4E2]WAN70101.1 hypothetical protein BJP36_39280 [Moorena producens JHB]
MMYTDFFLFSRLDAVAHGGNPQDRAASLFPIPCSLFPVRCSLFPVPCSLFPIKLLLDKSCDFP